MGLMRHNGLGSCMAAAHEAPGSMGLAEGAIEGERLELRREEERGEVRVRVVLMSASGGSVEVERREEMACLGWKQRLVVLMEMFEDKPRGSRRASSALSTISDGGVIIDEIGDSSSAPGSASGSLFSPLQ